MLSLVLALLPNAKFLKHQLKQKTTVFWGNEINKLGISKFILEVCVLNCKIWKNLNT
jgi:hypothetical protein